MKKLIGLSLIIIAYLPSFGQVTYLHENFDVMCAQNGLVPTPSSFPNWLPINLKNPAANLGWRCSAQDGRNGTGCVECTNYYNSADNLDTAYLITPQIDISSIPGPVYFIFDAKTNIWNLGARLSLEFKTDSPTIHVDSSMLSYAAMPAPTPTFGPADSTDWVTHVVDISNLKTQPFFITFRFTGSTLMGSTWYIDNVNISDTPAAVRPISRGSLNFTVSQFGQGLGGSFYSKTEGPYYIYLYDMSGKCIRKETIQAVSGINHFNWPQNEMPAGLYCIRLANGDTAQTLKFLFH